MCKKWSETKSGSGELKASLFDVCLGEKKKKKKSGGGNRKSNQLINEENFCTSLYQIQRNMDRIGLFVFSENGIFLNDNRFTDFFLN